MRGYTSFVLVFLAVTLLVSMLYVYSNSKSSDLSKAIVVERMHLVEMDAKAVALSQSLNGARMGFSSYSTSHDLALCKHCTDNFCSPDPHATNFCNDILCSRCFRESDARNQAAIGAELALAGLNLYKFDPDFEVSFGPAVLSAFLASNSTARNGLLVDRTRFENDLQILISSRQFNISRTCKIPVGVVAE